MFVQSVMARHSDKFSVIRKSQAKRQTNCIRGPLLKMKAIADDERRLSVGRCMRPSLEISALIFFAQLLSPIAVAQNVVPDVKVFTGRECRWLYSRFLDECMEAQKCTEMDFSMSTSRGMSSLETVLTVRSANEINYACNQVCVSKRKMDYNQWRKSICKPLIR